VLRELFFSKGSISESEIVITDLKDLHHLKNVHRKQIGDPIMVVSENSRYHCLIKCFEEGSVVLTICDISEIHASEVSIDIALALLKQDKMHLAIQKLAELGLSKLIPIQTQNCVVKLDEKKSKWDTIALETLKQCGGDKKLEIAEITSLKALRLESYDLVLVAWERESTGSIKELLKGDTVKKILYIIGPEGGFAVEEIEALKQRDVKSVTLGRNILRAETAAIVLGGILKYECE